MDDRSAGSEVAGAAPKLRTNLVRVDLENLEHVSIPAPTYALEPLIPYGLVTLLAAHGGAGKSVLALTLAAHFAVGRSWAGLDIGMGTALYVSLEDSGDLVRWRLRRICRAYGLDMEAVANGVVVLDGTAGDTALASEVFVEGVRRLHSTVTLEELSAAAESVGLVVIDNASDAFDGDENARRQVRGFLRLLGSIARENDAAVLLLAHVDKTAARYGAAGNSYSGSTAWHNSARSRLALVHAEGGGVELVHEKLNVGKPRAPISLVWHDLGVLMPAVEETPSPAQAASAEHADDDDVFAAIAAAGAAGIIVPSARTGPATALQVLATLPEFPKWIRTKTGRQRFWEALTRLQRKGRVELETYRNSARQEKERIVARQSSATVISPHPYATGTVATVAVPAACDGCDSSSGTVATVAIGAERDAA